MNNLEMLQKMSLEEMADFLSQFCPVIDMATDSYCTHCEAIHNYKCIHPGDNCNLGYDNGRDYIKWWLQQSKGSYLFLNKK